MMERTVLRLSGPDMSDFLQGLITNDIARLADGLVYAAILTPQGKYLADFFLLQSADDILLDVAAPLAADLTKRLTMYKLRAKVEIAPTDIKVLVGDGDAPAGAFTDPRHAKLGWRAYGDIAGTYDDYDRQRIRYMVPESTIELIPNDSFILEMNFEALNGVDFKKGCYVGQEVTARMKHKTNLRKGLARVAIDGSAEPGAEITANGKSAGQLYSQSSGEGLAYLRFDRATGAMTAGEATVTRL
ncbi:folate-binding protein YgfZ [Actibacterium sp. 188UL27-1]|uniref:CAF17-like 4Fe-4S cluster assembly/insertion protein YgfZ n=1 Tax=Actibacterium sp. 188UL27-1 TaxID=2786961 RepID=UPI00195709E2|nr:folate-binding protein YgfZ [Actibacterium sp. 188UL27-1]MBM7068275.1 folate-binding protein YgfZ [Actibacterium sp. 188UL27-1]